MKKVILFAVSAFAVFAMSAQVYVGGSLGFSTTSLKNVTEDNISGVSFQIRPEVGYHLNEKWSIGIELGYTQGLPTFGNLSLSDAKGVVTSVAGAALDVLSSDKFGIHETSEIKVTGLAVAPYARYNFISNKYFDLFVEGRIGYTSAKISDTETYNDGGELVSEEGWGKANIFEVSVRPGVAVKVTDKLNLTAKVGYLGYQHIGTDVEGAPKDADLPSISRFGLNLNGNNLLFGLSYNF